MATAAERAATVLRFLARAGLFAVAVATWHLVVRSDSSRFVSGLLIVGPIVLVFPVVWLGRRMLDARPTVDHIANLNGLVHFVLMVLFGVAIVEAVQTAQSWRGWTIPVPAGIGLALAWVSGLATILTVVNLAVRGLGAPFAIALSRRLATDWMYRWTRNPMVLAVLAFLASLGVWARSTLFLLWVLLLVAPAWLYFVKVYEERELEIRFGAPYLEYRARTPMLLPGKPRR